MKVSIVINADTRPERKEQEGLFSGTVNEDFLNDGVFNKIKFFQGFDIEVILFIDIHNLIPESTLEYIRSICDVVVLRRHTDEPKFNDWNYWGALSMARGEIIVHFDQDTAAFSSSKEAVQGMIDLLGIYDYVSYPSLFSPNPDSNPNYDYYWCSTRFFMCKRETLDFTEIRKCLEDSDFLYGRYPASVRNPWMEHVLALISKYKGNGVYYPPISLDKLAIFSWGSYEKYTLRRLNEYTYEELTNWLSIHPILYPNDISV